MGTKKRGNGQGSVYKLANGKWCAERTIGYDAAGLRKTKKKSGFHTKKEALAFLQSEKEGKSYEKIIVEQVYQMILPELQMLSKSKQIAYHIAYRRIFPLKYRVISEIRLPEMQRLLDDAPGSFYPKRDVKALLRKIFRYAVINGWCEKDYTQYLRLPPCQEPKKQSYTEDDLARMWDGYSHAEAGSTSRLILASALIMVYTGMRTVEMLSAKKGDVHFKEHYLTCGIKTTTGKNRLIPICQKIEPVLREVYMASRDRLIPYGHNLFYEKYKEVMANLHVSPLPPGCCRHTFNTRLAKKGVQPAVIQKAAGHKDYKTTIGYTHMDIRDVLDAVNKL